MSKKNADILGQKIAAVRPMTKTELESEGWEDVQGCATAIVLENGVKLYASQDPEGNGPGCVFGKKANGDGFFLA